MLFERGSRRGPLIVWYQIVPMPNCLVLNSSVLVPNDPIIHFVIVDLKPLKICKQVVLLVYIIVIFFLAIWNKIDKTMRCAKLWKEQWNWPCQWGRRVLPFVQTAFCNTSLCTNTTPNRNPNTIQNTPICTNTTFNSNINTLILVQTHFWGERNLEFFWKIPNSTLHRFWSNDSYPRKGHFCV